MSDKAHQLDKPFQAGACIETNEDVRVITEALNRIHMGCQKHSNELIEARNQLARLKSDHSQLKSESDALLQEKTNLEKRLQEQAEKATELTQHQQLKEALTQKIAELEALRKEQITLQERLVKSEDQALQMDQKNRELAKQAKENHDLNLLLMEKENQHTAYRKQTEKRIQELQEVSHTVQQMKKMLGELEADALCTKSAVSVDGFELLTPSRETSLIERQSPEAMEESFERWLNPSGGPKTHFSLIDE